MTNWFKKYNDADKELYNIPLQLRELANAFFIDGNNAVGDELYEISDIINKCRENMRYAKNQSIEEMDKSLQK